MNGTRRPLIEVTAYALADENYASDPLKWFRYVVDVDENGNETVTDTRNTNVALDLMKDPVIETEDNKIHTLAEFYRNNLFRKNLDTEETLVLDPTIKFYPEYYIIGLSSSVQKNNKTLIQTVGWEDVRRGGMGTFDPLAE